MIFQMRSFVLSTVSIEINFLLFYKRAESKHIKPFNVGVFSLLRQMHWQPYGSLSRVFLGKMMYNIWNRSMLWCRPQVKIMNRMLMNITKTCFQLYVWRKGIEILYSFFTEATRTRQILPLEQLPARWDFRIGADHLVLFYIVVYCQI